MMEAIGNGFEAAFWCLGFGLGICAVLAVAVGVAFVWEWLRERL